MILPKDWEEFTYKVSVKDILNTVKYCKDIGKTIYPQEDKIFRSFELTPVDSVRVVILGQDPYHGDGEANGLCFSVDPGVKTPPSLRNILKELESDTGLKRNTTDLTDWAMQGVLLLNSILTVEKDIPASHKDIGWSDFTDSVISEISNNKDGIIFVLWGNFAKSKEHLIDSDKHHIIKSNHPSPLSARKGFFGSKPFSQINSILENKIDW